MKFRMEWRALEPCRNWSTASLSLAVILYVVQQFFYSHTIVIGLGITAAALLACLVILFKISDRQAGLALEAECAEWR